MDSELKYIKKQYEELSVKYHDLDHKYDTLKKEHHRLQDDYDKMMKKKN